VSARWRQPDISLASERPTTPSSAGNAESAHRGPARSKRNHPPLARYRDL